jgi:hypothetical protein
MRIGKLKGLSRAATVAGIVALIGGCSDAEGNGQILGTFPGSSTVGETLPVEVQLTNTSGGPVTVFDVKVLPSCAAPVFLGDGTFVHPSEVLECPAPETGVFALVPDPTTPLTGDCIATGFSVGPPDGQGIVTLTPTGPNQLIVPDTKTCTLHLVQTTERVPSVDVDAGTAGTQTHTGVGVHAAGHGDGTAAANFGGELDADGTPGTVTVLPAPTPPPTATPAPQPAEGGAHAVGDPCGAITDRPECPA